MSNTDLPGKPNKSPHADLSDIPEALRDAPEVTPQSTWRKEYWVWGLVGLVGAIAVGGMGLAFLGQQSSNSAKTPSGQVATSPSDPNGSNAANPAQDSLLGHLPYKEAPDSELETIVADGSIKLRKAAAEKFREMEAAAQADGVTLVPLSGFRSLDDQQHLFFDVKAERGQEARKRAEVSAPPGYSEHHTGYALDIGDADAPATNVSPTFENTAAFKWLEQNAAFYSFELSFPKDNPQGVSYEPWHWRYVGDRDSLETFYKAKNFTAGSPSPATEAP